MKDSFLASLVLCVAFLLPLGVFASEASGSNLAEGWRLPSAPAITPENFQSFTTQTYDGPLPEAVTIRPDAQRTQHPTKIAELARSLRYDPDLIYKFVHDTIQYEPYWGARKGALGTLLDKSAGPLDQATLMIELLRASGVTARFVYGTMTLDGDTAAALVGVNNDAYLVVNIYHYGDLYIHPGAVISNWRLISFDIKHAWVEAEVDGGTYYFDPSFKNVETVTAGTDTAAAMGYDRAAFLSAATSGATITSDTASNISRTGIRNQLDSYTDAMVQYLEANATKTSLPELFGGIRRIVPISDVHRDTSLPNRTIDNIHDEIQSIEIDTLTISCPGFDATFNVKDIYGKRLTITYDEYNRPLLMRDGVTYAAGFHSPQAQLRSPSLRYGAVFPMKLA